MFIPINYLHWFYVFDKKTTKSHFLILLKTIGQITMSVSNRTFDEKEDFNYLVFDPEYKRFMVCDRNTWSLSAFVFTCLSGRNIKSSIVWLSLKFKCGRAIYHDCHYHCPAAGEGSRFGVICRYFSICYKWTCTLKLENMCGLWHVSQLHLNHLIGIRKH